VKHLGVLSSLRLGGPALFFFITQCGERDLDFPFIISATTLGGAVGGQTWVTAGARSSYDAGVLFFFPFILGFCRPLLLLRAGSLW